MSTMLKQVALVVVVGLMLPQAGFGAPSEVLGKAISMLRSVRQTRYQHETQINESRGQYFADCSGFMAYVLERTAPEAWVRLEKMTQKYEPGVARPLAKHFVYYFDEDMANIKGWHSVKQVEDLRPGDIIAWLTPDDSDSKNTGHVMFVASHPKPSKEHAREYEIRVIDSTRSGHGGGDPRTPKGKNGLGTGVINLIEAKDGSPYAYRWKGPDSTRIYKTTIRLARAQE